MGCAKVTAWCWHPITIHVIKNYLEDSLGGRSPDVTCPSSQCGHIHYIFFFCFCYLKTLLAILLLRDKNLEKTIPVGSEMLSQP